MPYFNISSSPSAPRGGLTGPSTPLSEYRGCNKMDPLKTQLPSGQYIAYLGRQGNHHAEPHGRPAKEVLRTLISSEDMDDAWAWLVKLHNYSGALCYQDNDKVQFFSRGVSNTAAKAQRTKLLLSWSFETYSISKSPLAGQSSSHSYRTHGSRKDLRLGWADA